MKRQTIPVFYSCDDSYVKYVAVSLYSLIKNASPDCDYEIHVLYTSIKEETQKKLKTLENDHVRISFDNVSDFLVSIEDKMPIRDYYNMTTYFRFFIAEMFPEYDKAIYIDGDTIVQGDISELYFHDIKDAYVAACHDMAFVQVDLYGQYPEKVLGISRYNFLQAGVMLINCDQFRIRFVLDRFVELLHEYTFVVTQDEDYLNLICKDHVYWLDSRWNTTILFDYDYPIEEAKIIHYAMTAKPWHYDDCTHGGIFWSYAKETWAYGEVLEALHSYTDEQKEKDRKVQESYVPMVLSEINKEDNYLNNLNRQKRNQERVDIVKKIEQYEREGRFDEDVELDPPSKELPPDAIDYYRRNLFEKLKRKAAFTLARRYVNSLISDKKLIIKGYEGIENFRNLATGAVITCNHFHAFDSFLMQLAYEQSDHPDKDFYRVIKEGNYTSFPGFYGFLMRHCNTLPLSSNKETLRKFMDATETLLREGNFVLIYPEQSMWWNYRKPKPLKEGAYTFAARSHVPVLPCFITMQDSNMIDDDGYYIQEYTIHVGKPIYPDESLPYGKREKKMIEENSQFWKETYEKVYHIPLTYLCDEKGETAEVIQKVK